MQKLNERSSLLFGLMFSCILLISAQAYAASNQWSVCQQQLSFSTLDEQLTASWQQLCEGQTEVVINFSPVATATLIHLMDKALHGITLGIQNQLLFQWDHTLTAEIHQPESGTETLFRLTDPGLNAELQLTPTELVNALATAKKLGIKAE